MHVFSGTLSILILIITFAIEVYLTLNKYPKHYCAIFGGYCCENNTQSKTVVKLYGWILPIFQQLTTLIYNLWISTFVKYWTSKTRLNIDLISKECTRCKECPSCRNDSICVFCGRNANNVTQLEDLKKKAEDVESYSKVAIASTENSLMPMIQLSVLFPTIIASFTKDTIAINNVEDFKENWIFFGTVFSVSSSILSMAASQTAKYFVSCGKEEQKTIANRIFYGLSIILQTLAKVIVCQTFAFGVVGYAFKQPYWIMVTLLVLPILMSIFKILTLLGFIFIKKRLTKSQNEDDEWSMIKTPSYIACLLLTSTFVLIRLQGYKNTTSDSEQCEPLNGKIKKAKGDLISESFSLWLKSPM